MDYTLDYAIDYPTNYMDYGWMYNDTDYGMYNDMDDDSTRIIIFLVIGVCVGVPAVSWALRMLFLHGRAGGRVSIFIIFLLISDVLELFLIPFFIASIVSHQSGFDDGLTFVFAVTRLYGLCFHQLVALESIMSVRHPHCISCLSSPFCSIPICLGIWICTWIYLISPLLLVFMGFGLFAVAVIVALLTCVFTAKSSCSCADSETTSHKDRGTRLCVLAVALGNLLLLYAPFVVWLPLNNPGASFGSIFVCIMSFRLVADPLLCVLVCRENPRRQPTQTGIELNTVQTSD